MKSIETKKGNVNSPKMQLWPSWRSRTLWLSLGWALRLALFAPADAPAQSLLFTAPPQLTNGGYLLRLSSPTGRVFEVQACAFRGATARKKRGAKRNVLVSSTSARPVELVKVAMDLHCVRLVATQTVHFGTGLVTL